MADGQLSKIKVGFLIQARMKSIRLPNKVLMNIPLGSGKPIIQWIVDELKRSVFAGEIIIATSINSENDVLFDFCRSKHIKCFRGSEEDVLSRFIKIEESEKFDVIVRLTADNPIIDIAILDKTIQFHLDSKNDYTKTEGLPIGMNFEIISPRTLLDLQNQHLSSSDKEHVTLFIKNSNLYKKGIYCPVPNSTVKNLRLTVDYPSDFMVISSVLSLASETNKVEFGLVFIEKIFRDYPWIFDINSGNIQQTPI